MEEKLYSNQIGLTLALLLGADALGCLNQAVEYVQQLEKNGENVPHIISDKIDGINVIIINKIVLVLSDIDVTSFANLANHFPQHIIVPADMLKDFFIYTDNALKSLQEVIQIELNSLLPVPAKREALH